MDPRHSGESHPLIGLPHVKASTLRRVRAAVLAAAAVAAAAILIAVADPGGIFQAGAFTAPVLGHVEPVAVAWNVIAIIAAGAAAWHAWTRGHRHLYGEHVSAPAAARYVSAADGVTHPADQPYLYARPDLLPAPSLVGDGGSAMSNAAWDYVLACTNLTFVAEHLAAGQWNAAALSAIVPLIMAFGGTLGLLSAQKRSRRAHADRLYARREAAPAPTPCPSREGIGRGREGTVGGMVPDETGPRWIGPRDVYRGSDGILWVRPDAQTHRYRRSVHSPSAIKVEMAPAGAEIVLRTRNVWRNGEPQPGDIPVSRLSVHATWLGDAVASSWELR